MKNYWLHRIKHEWYTAKPLLDKGYLTIGWQGLMARSQRLRECIAKNRGEGFELLMKELNETSRSRWSLKRFSAFLPGDIVVVPLYDHKFAIAEVIESAKSILELPIEIVNELDNINLSVDGLFDAKNNRTIDIGFFVKVKTPVKVMPRSYAEDKLQKKMSTIGPTNTPIDDLASAIIKVDQCEATIEVHEVTEERTDDVNLYRIHLKTDTKVDREELIKHCLYEKSPKIAIGWSCLHKNNPNLKTGFDLSEAFKQDKKENPKGKTKRPLACFARLKTNDLVWTRDLNGIYYLCRVTSEPKAECNVTLDIGATATVEKIEVDTSVSGGIISRFTRPNSPTIEPIYDKSCIEYSKYIYNKYTTSDYRYERDSSFKFDLIEMLPAKDMEELVLDYIQIKYDYYLSKNSVAPLSTTIKIECEFFPRTKGQSPAVCQVSFKGSGEKFSSEYYQKYVDAGKHVFLFFAKHEYDEQRDGITYITKEEIVDFAYQNKDILPPSINYWIDMCKQ